MKAAETLCTCGVHDDQVSPDVLDDSMKKAGVGVLRKRFWGDLEKIILLRSKNNSNKPAASTCPDQMKSHPPSSCSERRKSDGPP